MRYVLIEESAVDEIVSDRAFQSTEYGPGQGLIEYLRGDRNELALPPQISAVVRKDGVGLFGPSASINSHFLVIDTPQSDLFSSVLPSSECLLAFQKTLRFAKKMWGGLRTNFSEMIPPQSTKAIVFPFPYAARPYRVVIEREPWRERLAKRGHKGMFLLVYKAGYDSGDAKKEVADETNFRKAYSQLRDFLSDAIRGDHPQSATDQDLASLKVTEADFDGISDRSTIYRSFSSWLPLLTQSQRDFVESPIRGAHRIEGPAWDR